MSPIDRDHGFQARQFSTNGNAMLAASVIVALITSLFVISSGLSAV